GVHPAVAAAAGEHDERRGGDELRAVRVDMVDDLPRRAVAGRLAAGPQILVGGDDAGKPAVEILEAHPDAPLRERPASDQNPSAPATRPHHVVRSSRTTTM